MKVTVTSTNEPRLLLWEVLSTEHLPPRVRDITLSGRSYRPSTRNRKNISAGLVRFVCHSTEVSL